MKGHCGRAFGDVHIWHNTAIRLLMLRANWDLLSLRLDSTEEKKVCSTFMAMDERWAASGGIPPSESVILRGVNSKTAFIFARAAAVAVFYQ